MWRARAYLNLGMRVYYVHASDRETQTHGGRGPAAEPPKQKNSKPSQKLPLQFHFATHTPRACQSELYIPIRVYATTVMHAERTDR
jgi:hypothetical protein